MYIQGDTVPVDNPLAPPNWYANDRLYLKVKLK